ncbi:MAG: thrombospondin type 3 repeat-containing protein, partial [Deltaproteobacteria bacterium]|nr:thrombospondin type 3 repeat-containing protein [Deltaproteobacteria bacterium]
MRTLLTVLLTASALFQVGCSCGESPSEESADAGAMVDPLQAPLAELNATSADPTFLQLEPGGLVAAVGRWTVEGADRVERAKSFVDAHRLLLGLDDRSELNVRRSALFPLDESATAERVVFYQRFKGLRVEGAGVSVLMQGAEVRGILSRVSAPSLELDVQPAITGQYALDLVRPTLSDPTATEWAAPELVILDSALSDPQKDSQPKLAWRLAIGRQQVFVDAKTGERLATRTNVFDNLDVEVDDDYYTHETWTSATCKSAGTCGNGVYQLLHNFALTYVWYKSNLNWVSYDNADSSMYVDLMAKADYYANSNGNDFQFSAGSQVLDIVGHEFTHSVIRSTSDLEYENQPGAINESFADLFGALVEGDLPPGVHGEDSGKGASRHMCRPALYHQPEHYQDYKHMSEDVDHGGVHINSGIGNRAWCSVVERFIAQGMTEERARKQVAKIGFATMLLLPDAATYSQLRGSALAAGFTVPAWGGDMIAQVCALVDAFEEVGLPGGGSAIQQACHSASSDRDGDGVPDSTDNCPDTLNPSQANLDKDDLGDACDTDWDGDSVPNDIDLCPRTFDPKNVVKYGEGAACYWDQDEDGVGGGDNCPSVANPDQKDGNHDGIGDACTKDYDHDGVDDHYDNCPFDPNPNKADADHDSIGDACDPCPNNYDEYAGWTSGDPSKGIPAEKLFPDADKDGIPDSCDPSPHGMAQATGLLGPGGGVVEVNSSGSVDAPIFVPLNPCLLPSCPTDFDEDSFVVLQIGQLTEGAQVAVVDDHGQQVARTDSRGSTTLQFRPRGGTRYRVYIIPPPGGGPVLAQFTPTRGSRNPTNSTNICLGRADGSACSLAGGAGVCDSERCVLRSADGGIPAGPDAGAGAGADAGLDASAVAGPDAAAVAGPDAAAVAGPDAAAVAGPDAAAVAGLDAAAVAGPDAAAVAGPDAGPGAGPDASMPPTYSSCDAPAMISDGTGTPFDGDVAIDGLGDAVVAWREYVNPNYYIKVARYSITSGWSAPVNLANAKPQVLSPHVVVNAMGDAFVHWLEPSTTSSFWVSRWDASTTSWEAPVNLLTLTNSVSAGKVVIDDAGNGWAVFLQAPPPYGGYAVWARRYLAGSGWQAVARADGSTAPTASA